MSNAGILILADASNGKPSRMTTELLGAGRRIASTLGEQVSALVLGDAVTGVEGELVAFGADTVYLAEDPSLFQYTADAYISALEKACAELSPRVLLIGHDSTGRDLAPRLAFRMRLGIAPDCVDLDVDSASGSLVAIKPVYGGNVLARVGSKTRPELVTIRPRTQEPLQPDRSRSGNVVELDLGLGTISSRM